MAPSVKRRHTTVDYAKQIIQAISSIKEQKQQCTFDRISKYLQRYTDITQRRCKEHLNNAVSDGFIIEYTYLGNKGQNTGKEQEGYRLPKKGEAEDPDDGHDWYCFECHNPGEVYECSECFRVYHQGCTREDTTGDAFVCSVCRASKKKNKMKKKMLNTLLSYTILRLREKGYETKLTRELHKISLRGNTDDFKRFVYKRMDLNKMEQRVQASRYRCLEDFHADARTIWHNCFLIFGDEKGGMTDLAVMMVKDCKYDLEEIELCPNCYYMSNAKPEDWFAQPCNPPHELVYAKQKGYSYWPAKVVKDVGGKSDVRFFGGWHQRAIIPAESIKPITTELKSMAIKKTAGFTKSMKELKKHQDILEEREKELAATNGASQEEEEEEEEEDEEEDSKADEEDQQEAEELEQAEREEEEEKVGKDVNVAEEEEEVVRKYTSTKKTAKKRKREEIEEEAEEEEEVEKYRPKKTAKRRKREIEEVEEEEEEEEEEVIRKHTPKKSSKKKKRDSTQIRSKTPKKRRSREAEEEEEEDDEDIDNRQVTSTSVEKKARQQKRNLLKSSINDEAHTVTSSGDNAGAACPPVPTATSSCQTLAQESVAQESSWVQTEPMGLGEDRLALESAQMEERMAQAMAQLTQRLEEKFEEDKKQALQELEQRLEEDFGKDKQQAVERTIASMKQEVEKARGAGEDKTREQYMEEMRKLAAKHKEAISQAKKKQWCQSCEDEAIYHCCWNTSYCSTKCQQMHWHKEHKRVCRRKRPEAGDSKAAPLSH